MPSTPANARAGEKKAWLFTFTSKRCPGTSHAPCPGVALLPLAAELDEEAGIAAEFFPQVLRFSATWSEDGSCKVSVFAGPGPDGEPWTIPYSPEVHALHRGFLLSAPRFRALSESLRTTFGLHILASPEQHELCGYYPLQYPLLSAHTTRVASSSTQFRPTTVVYIRDPDPPELARRAEPGNGYSGTRVEPGEAQSD